jgi:hypothetical protein
MGTPQEMANAEIFLAAWRRFITGTNLVVDGALTKGVQFCGLRAGPHAAWGSQNRLA